MTRLETLCKAIEQTEGWYFFSRSWKNNNPGNLRSSPFAAGVQGGFAMFANYASGWLALWWDVWMKCQGRTRTNLTPDSTLMDLAAVWAPGNDGNDSESYGLNLAERCRVPPSTPLKWFLEDMKL